MNWSSLNLMQM